MISLPTILLGLGLCFIILALLMLVTEHSGPRNRPTGWSDKPGSSGIRES